MADSGSQRILTLTMPYYLTFSVSALIIGIGRGSIRAWTSALSQLVFAIFVVRHPGILRNGSGCHT